MQRRPDLLLLIRASGTLTLSSACQKRAAKGQSLQRNVRLMNVVLRQILAIRKFWIEERDPKEMPNVGEMKLHTALREIIPVETP